MSRDCARGQPDRGVVTENRRGIEQRGSERLGGAANPVAHWYVLPATLVGNTGQKMETPDGSGVITATAGTVTLPSVIAWDGQFKWDNTDSTWYEQV